MNLIPFKKFRFKTRLSQKETLELLRENIEPTKPFVFMQKNSYSKPYFGEVYTNGFVMTRVTGTRNSFLPNISGSIIESSTGTVLDVRMMMNPVAIAFLIFWLGGTLLMSTLTTIQLFIEPFNPLFLMPHAMFVFGVILSLTGYLEEVNVSKEDIKEIISGEIVSA